MNASVWEFLSERPSMGGEAGLILLDPSRHDPPDPAANRQFRPSSHVVIGAGADLDLLWRQLSRPGRPRPSVSLQLPMSEPRRSRLERRINRDLAACGCTEGTAAGLLYVVAVPFIIGGYVPHSVGSWLFAGAGFIGALMLGKGAGLMLARWRLRRSLKVLRRLLPRSPSF